MTQSAQAAVVAQEAEPSYLRFLTTHKDYPALVDLHEFVVGTRRRTAAKQVELRVGPLRRSGPGSRALPFTGRPQLVTELGPLIQVVYAGSPESTVRTLVTSLRGWWRFFDYLDAQASKAGVIAPAVHSVKDLTAVHRQLAVDYGISWQVFGPFKRLAELARTALRLPSLYWREPERREPTRDIPTFEHVKAVRHALKHRWYAALDRWDRADALLCGEPPASIDEVRVLCNYMRLAEAALASGKEWPTTQELSLGRKAAVWNNGSGLTPEIMRRCRYADREDVLAAFHLCLSTTGWNPQTLLDLDLADEPIKPHPKDPSRYEMRGYKARSKVEQSVEGLYKTERSPGVVILKLAERNQPLREQLTRAHEEQLQVIERLKESSAPRLVIDRAAYSASLLEQGTRSCWLFADEDGAIGWLTSKTYGKTHGKSYLGQVIERINAKAPLERQVPTFTPTDFRDAFAAYAYHHSGGMVLYVMKVLGHKWLLSTQKYINNTLLNERSAKVFRTFSNALWKEVKLHKRVDPTILAKWVQDGDVSEHERQRLYDYRSLRRSRLGIGCKDPCNPPPHIAPGFVPDGTRKCGTQRCTLCLENAVILPESIDGLAMRFAELEYLKDNMSLVAFSESSFAEELENTSVALMGFDAQLVEQTLAHWRALIRSGQHRPPQFELLQGGAA